MLPSPIAGDPVSHSVDARQLFGVDVQQLARSFALVPHRRLQRLLPQARQAATAEQPLLGYAERSWRFVGTSAVVLFAVERPVLPHWPLWLAPGAVATTDPEVPPLPALDTAPPIPDPDERSDRLPSTLSPRSTPPAAPARPAALDSPGNFAHSCECPSGLLRAICSF